MAHDPTYLGLKLYELLTLLGIVLGPIVAVLITLWVDSRRRNREQKLTVLRMLLTTRHVPADPAFQVAVNLIPAEFGKSRAVMDAYKEFSDAAGIQLDGVNNESVLRNTGVKTTRLVYAIARNLKFDIRETDIQTRGYISQGWVDRENTMIDSQKAMRDIATILLIQTRLIANQALSEAEQRYIGVIDDQK